MADLKQRLRAQLRAARRALPAPQRAAECAAAAAACLALLRRLAPPALASYAALPDELDLAEVHRGWDGILLLPRVAGPGRLAWHRVRDLAALRPGAYGIREPDPTRAPEAEPPPGSVVLVPGTGFTRAGHRLGQGGGFYDRLLAGRPDLLAVGVGFACQLLPELPCEAHDRPLAGLVIAGELIRDPRHP